MKNSLAIILVFLAKILLSQNGFTTYTYALPANSNFSIPVSIYVDNSGNTWLGHVTPSASSNTVLSVYKPSTNSWSIYTLSNSTFPPNCMIQCFKEDNIGNMWMGTVNGLVKFDGVNFTLYTTSNGLPDNNILSLDYINNMLYIGTKNGGLSRFDGTIFTNYNIANSLFPTNYINCVKAENANTIWVASNNQLIEFSINSSYSITSYSTSISNPTLNINDINIDATGNKWLHCYQGVTKFKSGVFTYFNTLYPDASFNFQNVRPKLIKGPNGGLMYVTDYFYIPNGLVELMPNNLINYYYRNPVSASNSLNRLLGNIASNNSGQISITATFTGNVTGFVSFNNSNYSPLTAFTNNQYVFSQDNSKFLDINKVKAKIHNRGDMHGGFENESAFYEVPKGSRVNAGNTSGFWIGGLDPSNQLHIAAQTYRQRGTDFWPGPLDTVNGTTDPLTSYKYDKIWKVSYTDINNFITQFNAGNVPLSYTPTPDIVNWPAHGTGSNAKNLAPFVDVNGDGIYNWQDGDYPKIKGDQALYSIFNDNFGGHSESLGLPLGVEVHCMAYAYGCPTVLNGRNELAYTTFYDYKIYNRSNTNYHDVYVSQFCDADLGMYGDDYIGSSIPDNLGFVYNSDSIDNNLSSLNGYNQFPPACGRLVLKGPIAPVNDLLDNDNDSIIDEIAEQCLMNTFDYYNDESVQFPIWHVTTPFRYHNYMEGRWYDSTNFTCGGVGWGGTTPTKFVYPWANYLNNPCGNWSESTAGNLAGDRRYILSSGPFNLLAKDVAEVEYAMVWSVDSSATTNINLASVDKLISDTRKIKSFYNGVIPSCLQKINIGINETEKLSNTFSLFPNPSHNFIQIKSESQFEKYNFCIVDVAGRIVRNTTTSETNPTIVTVSDLNAGVYFIKIQLPEGPTVVKKFVKQ